MLFILSIMAVISAGILAANKKADTETILYPVQVGGKWGYINKMGKIAIKPSYAWADDFHEGVAIVETIKTSNGSKDEDMEDRVRYGAIDSSGKMVVKPVYSSITKYTEGVAGAIIADNAADLKYFILNNKGKVLYALPENMQIVSMLFNGSQLPTQSEGMILVQDDLTEKYGYINRYGKVILPYQYNEAANFSNGLALVKNDHNQNEYIDAAGKVKIDASKYITGKSFSEGLAAVAVQDKKSSAAVYGYIDTQGNMKIKPQFARAYAFSEGLAKVCVGESINSFSIGYIDPSGVYRIGPHLKDNYEETLFSEGLAPVDEGKGGYMDKDGRFSIRPIITSGNDNYLRQNKAGEFREGIAKVLLSDGRLGYIDRTGTYIWDPQ
ncbi:WG repeat-containing protein [Paenibacillus albus]|uniref:WG repeat-containing protein n=1 Tax=Paenibacillus albus TaxID=2495582 RepID=A0A3S9A9Y6_9BACL|nr:WG repeat-containing protein [Paenibacillus albus]AZN42416.1 WG repeat-containing protein [Paenibacillus albus]